MALAVPQVQHYTSPGGGAGTVATFAAPTTPGNLAVAIVGGYQGTAGPSSVTDNKGNTWTRDFDTSATETVWIAVYSAPIVTGGTTHTVTFNIAATGVSIANLDLIEVSGHASSSPLDKTVSNKGTGTAWTTGSTGTLAQADEIVFAYVAVDDGAVAAITQDATYTLIGENEDGATYISNAAYKIVASTAAINHAWTTAFGSVPWYAAAVTYKAAGGAGVTLSVDSAAHGHTAGNITLSTGFAVDSAVHGHTASQVLLPLTLAVDSASHAHSAAQVPLTQFRYPVGTSGRKLVDQLGDVFILNDFSSWGMASMLTNAEITQALEGVAARHFNAVNVGPFIDNGGAGNGWRKFTNAAGQPFFATVAGGSTAGTPVRDPLGAAWSSVDWIVAECTRLGLTLIFSYFAGYNTANGITGEANACTVAEVYTYGQRVWDRYAASPNIVWHLEWEGPWGPTDPEGQRADAFFHAIQVGHAGSGRGGAPLIFAEQGSGGNAGSFIGAGWTYMLVSASSLYQYVSNSVEAVDTGFNEAGTTTYPMWDCEPSYIGATQYIGGVGSYAALTDPVARQNWRERNYAILIRGGCGINFGDEKWWPFGAGGLYPSAPWTWQDVPTNVTSYEAQYCWDALIRSTVCKDPTWAPNSAWVTTGLGSGETKAACGAGATSLVAYFPDTRAVTINTTGIPGTDPVRLRWYDPTTGVYTLIGSEPRSSSRAMTYPPGTHADGNTDWLLVVDDQPAYGRFNVGTAPLVRARLGTVPLVKAYLGELLAWVSPEAPLTLTVQSATHAHAAGNVTLTGVPVTLTVQSATHAHAAPNLTLTGGGGGGGPTWSYDFTAMADQAQPATLTTFGGSIPGEVASGHFMCTEDWFFTKVYDTGIADQTATTHTIAAVLNFATASGQFQFFFAGDSDLSSRDVFTFNQNGTWLVEYEGGGVGGSPDLPAFTVGVPTKVVLTYNEATGAGEVFVDGVSRATPSWAAFIRTGTRSGWQMGGNLDVHLLKFYYGPSSAGVPT